MGLPLCVAQHSALSTQHSALSTQHSALNGGSHVTSGGSGHFKAATTWLRWRTFSLWTAVVLATGASLGILGLFILADALFRLPQSMLAALFLAWAGVSLAALSFLIGRLRRGRRSLAATARRVELAFPELESHLINIVQFAERRRFLETDPFRQAALAQAAAAVGDFSFDRAATRESRMRRFALCMQTPRDLLESSLVLVAILGIALVMNAIVPAWASSTRRLLHPFTFVPSVGSVKIVKVTPGDAEVLIGSGLRSPPRSTNPAPQAPAPRRSLCRQAGKPESALVMLPDENNQTYVAALTQVLAPLSTGSRSATSQTRLYKVSVYEKPTVAEVEAVYDFPAYLETAARDGQAKPCRSGSPPVHAGGAEDPSFDPIARGHLHVAGRDDRWPGGRRRQDADRPSSCSRRRRAYTIHLFTPGGTPTPSRG